jgi:hypothetical protein
MLEELFTEYLLLRAKGLTIDQALQTFDYLHPISLARLKKLIVARGQTLGESKDQKGGTVNVIRASKNKGR